MRHRPRSFLALGFAATLGLSAGVASAQRSPSSSVATDEAKPSGGTNSLKDLFGVPVAKRLLFSDSADDRIRGVLRLGSLGTDDAIEALIQALENGGVASADTRVRLVAVRILAAHTDKENARQVLIRELSTPVGPESRGTVSPLQSLLRKTAALALARAGTKKTAAPLLAAVERGGVAAEAAISALKAHPPTSLDSFFENKKKLPPSQVAFLGELGDLRAIEKLRPFLTGDDGDVKMAAAVALAKLGDASAAAAVAPWLKRGDPRLLKAAAETLIYLGAKEAGPAVAALLASDVTREAGLSLSLRAPLPSLTEALSTSLDKLSVDDKPRAIAAIGRAGGPAAAKKLAGLVEKGMWGTGPEMAKKEADAKDPKTKGDKGAKDAKDSKSAKKPSEPDEKADASKIPVLTFSALFALAIMPGEDAKTELGKLVNDSRSAKEDAIGKSILRAAVFRAIVRKEQVQNLEARLTAWATSKDDSARAVSTLGLVAIGLKNTADVVAACTEKKCDEAALRGAARGALARGASELTPFLDLLEQSWTRGTDLGKPGSIAVAAAVALLAHPAGRDIPTSVLAAWAEGGGALSPLAARALPSRDDDVTRGRIKRLLEGTDPVVRAHVALGLSKDPETDAVALLVDAYRFEDDAAVRAAIIRSLSERKETVRQETLEIAAALDPDDTVRALARAAMLGRKLAPAVSLTEAATWVSIEDNDTETPEKPATTSGTTGGAKTPGAARPVVPGRMGRVVRSDGIAVPFVADPDGALVLPGLSHQKFNLQLSPRQ